MNHGTIEDLPIFFGDYVIEDVIGQGGMKIVARAHHAPTGQRVALAILRSLMPNRETVARFEREATALRRLRHPNIVPIFEFGQAEGRHFLSMPFIESEPLSAAVLQGPLDSVSALSIVRQMAEAIGYAHQQGVVHRDIKPDNILINAELKPILIDFGLAQDRTSVSHLTRAGQALGTHVYIAPEQLEGKHEQVGPASDIYALGVTFLEMLMGRPIFHGYMSQRPPHEWARQLDRVNDGFGRRLTPELVAICQGCLQFEPAQRYTDMQHLVEAAEAAAGHSSLSPNPGATASPESANEVSHGAVSEPVLSKAERKSDAVVSGKYRLLTLLGRGGMGEVWKADRTDHNLPVVIKFLPQEFHGRQAELERLRRSFEYVAALSPHAAICPVYDIIDDPLAGPYLVMKYLDGIDLAQLVQRRKAAREYFTALEVCQLLFPIAQAVDHAHSRNVLHRDIKPDNIMIVQPDQQPMLVDFGIAEQARETLTKLNPEAAPYGTLHYLSPEAWRGKFNRESDLYALAIVAYELLAGSPPFADTRDPRVLRECVLHEPIPALNLPSRINQVFEKALAKEPDQRYLSGVMFIEQVRLASSAQPVQLTAPSQRWFGVTALAGSLAIVGFLLFTSDTQQWLQQALRSVSQKPTSTPKANSPAAHTATEIAPTENRPTENMPAEIAPEEAESTEAKSAEVEGFAPTPPESTPQPPSESQQSADSPANLASVDAETAAQQAYSQGLLHLTSLEYAAAIDDFSLALGLDSEFSEAFAHRGYAYVQLEQFESAIEDLKQAIELNPQYLVAHVDLAAAYRLHGVWLEQAAQPDVADKQYQISANCYSSALLLAPEHLEALFGRGLAKFRLRLFGEAILDFTSALAQDSNFADAYEFRGRSHFEREQFQEAKTDFETALRLAPQKTSLRDLLSRCEQQLAANPS